MFRQTIASSQSDDNLDLEEPVSEESEGVSKKRQCTEKEWNQNKKDKPKNLISGSEKTHEGKREEERTAQLSLQNKSFEENS